MDRMQALLSTLHLLSDIWIFCIVVLTVTSVAMAAPQLRRLLRLSSNETQSQAALDTFRGVLATTGVLLAFALVEANGNLHAIQAMVAKEAASIAAMDRALLRSGNPQLVLLRPELAAYGMSIVQDEWPSLAEADRSDATDEAYNALSRGVRSAVVGDPRQQAIAAELLKNLDDMAELREQRIASSEMDLPDFFWVTSGGMLAVAWCLAFLAADTLATAVALGATAAAVSLVLAFVMIVDQPFEGETSVKPREIVNVLALNERRR